jgi:potassium efflux system protein
MSDAQPRSTVRLLCLRFALIGTILLANLAALAQDPPALSKGTIGTLADAVRESTALTEEERAPLLVKLQEASRALEHSEAFSAEAARMQKAIEGSKDEVARYRAEIEDMELLPASVEGRLGSDPDLAEIVAEIDVIEAQRRTWAQQRASGQEAANGAAKGGAPVQERLVELRSQIDAVALPASSDELADKVEDVAVRARLQALRAEEGKLEIELRGAPALNEISAARTDWLEASINRSDTLLAALREVAADSRQSVAQQRLRETDRLLSQLTEPSAAVQDFAEGNRALLRDQQRLAVAMEGVQRDVAGLREQLEYIRDDSTLTERRMEVAGLSAELGEVMLTRLTSLPVIRNIESGIDARNTRIAEVSVQTIDIEEDLIAVADRSSFLRARFPELDQWSRADRRVLDRLYEQRRELTRDNLEAYNSLLRLLVDGNQVAEELVDTTASYQDFLTGNLLWIRNYAFADPARLLAQVAALADPKPYPGMISRLPELLGQPLLLLDGFLLFVLLLYRRRIQSAREALLGHPIRPSEESIRKIIKGLALAFVRALPLPLLLVILAGVPLHLGNGSVELEALGQALRAVAFMLLWLSFLLGITERTGTGRRLLKWNGPKLEVLRRDLVWLSPLASIAAGVAVYGHMTSPTSSGGPVAAAATFALSVGTLVYSLRVLSSGLFTTDTLVRYTLRGVALLSGAIVVMHLSGQLFAAHMYLRALGWTLAAGIVVLLVTNVLQRWILIYEGRLQRQQREEQQAALIAAEAAAAENGEAPPAERNEEVADHDSDAVASLSEAQAKLLWLARIVALSSLVWVIWSPALPAVTALEEIALWTTTDPSLPEGELRVVSLATLILAVLVIVVTALFTRHLPPLVQIILMEYGKASAGARYAIGMLMQYVIIGVGASIALSLMGFAWSKVQWLVAALGVGIGFGLQEIVANFISGIILLFERPIRPGDIISVSGFDGTVLKINPRATVIETFDRKEVMVPNKELITGVVNNWSLSSSTLRGVIPVGVAYGSDVHQAIAILYEVAQDNPRVLEDPAPMVTFEDFGDNALTLWLRCYGTSDYLKLWTDLRTEIYDRFNAAGIGIAFPQRDVHLDASAPIPVQVVGGDLTPKGGN